MTDTIPADADAETPPEPSLFEPPAAPRPRRKITSLLAGRQSSDGAASSPRTGERRPKAARRRVNLSDLGESIWTGAAWLYTARGNVPMGRVLSLQAGAAGPAFDQLVAGTPADRPLQALARTSDKGKEFGALVGLPLAMHAYLARPSPMTENMLRGAVAVSLPGIVKAAKQAARKQIALEKDLADLGPLFGKPAGQPVTMDDLLAYLLPASEQGEV